MRLSRALVFVEFVKFRAVSEVRFWDFVVLRPKLTLAFSVLLLWVNTVMFCFTV